MLLHRRSLALAAVATALLIGGLEAHAIAPLPDPGAEEFSPLFARRLEIGLEEFDRPSDQIWIAGQQYMMRQHVETPLSGNPASLCLGSGCILSVCFGSACISSRCLGSGCVMSGCGGSSCISSVCGGSACIGSACGGSACVGTGCAGSACLSCSLEGVKRSRPRG